MLCGMILIIPIENHDEIANTFWSQVVSNIGYRVVHNILAYYRSKLTSISIIYRADVDKAHYCTV